MRRGCVCVQEGAEERKSLANTFFGSISWRNRSLLCLFTDAAGKKGEGDQNILENIFILLPKCE